MCVCQKNVPCSYSRIVRCNVTHPRKSHARHSLIGNEFRVAFLCSLYLHAPAASDRCLRPEQDIKHHSRRDGGTSHGACLLYMRSGHPSSHPAVPLMERKRPVQFHAPVCSSVTAICGMRSMTSACVSTHASGAPSAAHRVLIHECTSCFDDSTTLHKHYCCT